MGKEKDDKLKKEREEYLRKQAERAAFIQNLPTEQFTKAIYESLSTAELKTLYNRQGFTDYLNTKLFAAPKPLEK